MTATHTPHRLHPGAVAELTRPEFDAYLRKIADEAVIAEPPIAEITEAQLAYVIRSVAPFIRAHEREELAKDADARGDIVILSQPVADDQARPASVWLRAKNAEGMVSAEHMVDAIDETAMTRRLKSIRDHAEALISELGELWPS